jgi:hypothetical protein
MSVPLGRLHGSDADAAAPGLFEGLTQSRAEVLLLESECDEVIPHGVIETYLRGCPKARHEVLAGAQHTLRDPVWESAFVAVVLRWFAGM